MMKLRMLCAGLCICCLSMAQLQPTEPDQSPMDMCYSPAGFPIIKFQANAKASQLNARVLYSRPQVKNREIFGGEIKYNELWRLGANESTELLLYKDAMIGGKKIPKGRYTLYCIPTPDSWTIVVNTDTDSWGGFSYKQALDLVRVKVPAQKMDTPVEYLTMYFDTPGTLTIMWSNVKTSLPIKFLTK